jgi:hypothetical protein
MRYTLTALLVLCVACGGGDAGTPSLTTAPGSLASIRINASTNTIAVGQTTTVAATGLDASGGTVAGGPVTWTSSATAVATVSGGLVTGVSAGSAVITATIGARSAQTTIVVVPAVSTSCAGVTPLALAVGTVHVMSASERATLCVGGGTAGSEYVLVPFKADTVSARVSVSLAALGTVATTGTPSAQIARTTAISSLGARFSGAASRGEFGAAFERDLRRKERMVLTPLAAANAPGAPHRRLSASRSAILTLPTTPVVGTFFPLNANGSDPCNNRQNHTARVAAVSSSAIIAVDSLAPKGGFSDAEYASFAATFDTLIFALDTSAYGAPSDIDNNGRVLIFFTQAVNQLTPRGANGFVGGFFFSRDLFPDTDQGGLLSACPASNEGEMFYVPVVDTARIYNEFFASDSVLRVQLYGTLAHEFQHLINASRRLYVTRTPNWDEEVWLNEGMSHIAEELLYFRESGFVPKANITLAAVKSTTAETEAANSYQVQNLLRLEDYLKAPGINSPYAQNDSLATRGATYQLLRYSLDESTGTNSSYLHALISTSNTGIVNFNTVFAGTFPDIFTAVQQQVLANFFGGSGIAVDPKYAFPSWDYRDVIGNGLVRPPANPLAMTALTGASASTTFALTGGGSAYARFGVAANGTAAITSASSGNAVPAAVVMMLVRTH